MPTILWLNDITFSDADAVGAKAANLAKASAAGFDVPDGFVVTADGYDRFLKDQGIDKVIRHVIANIKPDDHRAVNRASRLITKAIERAKLASKLTGAIGEAYLKLCEPFGGECLVAVRGGNLRSYLNISGAKAVTEAVHQLFAQPYEPRALYFDLVHGKKPSHPMILVQNMVQARSSGTILIEENIAIEAIWGLGEALTGGHLTPDRYLVDRQNFAVVERQHAHQTWRLEYSKGKNRHVSVPYAKQGKPKITDEEILELARLGAEAARQSGDNIQLEWAIDEQNRVWIVDLKISNLKSQISKLDTTLGWIEQSPSLRPSTAGEIGEVLARGIGASLGAASGQVVVVHSPAQADKIKPGSVLVAELTSPSYIQAMHKAAAVVIDTGGPTSHAAIACRELGLPCVLGAGHASQTLKNGVMVTVDGAKGVVYKGKIAISDIRTDHQLTINNYQLNNYPVTATKVYVNLSDPTSARQAAAMPVDGVGLLRAEFLIAQIGEHPLAAIKQGKGEQFTNKLAQGILTVAEAFSPRPITYRLSDLKTNEYRDLAGGKGEEPQEANPELGWRGLRRLLDQPELMALELEAVKRVRDWHGCVNVHLSLPFVRLPQEVKQALFLIAQSGLKQSNDFKITMMVELPANIFSLDEFAGLGIDGFAIGSNDLTQLMLGVDRNSSQLSQTYNERDEPILAALTTIIMKARSLGVPSSVCGNGASMYPEFLEAVVAAGATSVSVTPDVAIPVRRLVASIEKRLLLDNALLF